ncbi:MAG: hypothetical protein BMS9Abin36_2090 [Gammaproteobacteria bacterium]|nr:MAG: hypothetical protein BMS9Abin36_2090 [Gammaproteobacteria bacterium]
MTDETVQAAEPEKVDQVSDPGKTADDSLPVEKDATPSKRDRRAERRISKLTAKNAELEEGNVKLQGQLNELSQKVDTLATPEIVRPQRDDFESVEEYEDAVMDYRIDVRSAGSKPVSPKPKESDQAADPGLVKRFEGFIADSEKSTPGFGKVVSEAHFPLTDHSLVEIMDMGDEGAEVFTYLNANPTDAMRISQLSPRDQTIEIEKLADSLDTTSSAPEPITPLEGGDHPTVDESKLSPDQRIRKRQKEVADRQRSIRRR